MSKAKATDSKASAPAPDPAAGAGEPAGASTPAKTADFGKGDANSEGQKNVANIVTANPTLGKDVTRAAENPTLQSAGVPVPKAAKDDRPEAQKEDPNNQPGSVEDRAKDAPPREDWQ